MKDASGRGDSSATESGTSDRTIVFGLDGVSFEYLDTFASNLSTITSLREDGVEASLDSTFPPWTASAWPSMYTGTNPATHGVHGFFSYDGAPTAARIATRNDVQAPAIWNYLTALEEPSIVLNVPVTHPSEPINGVLIPGYLAPEESDGYPNDIRDRYPEYRIYSEKELDDANQDKLQSYIDLIKVRGEVAAKILQEEDWRFAFIQVQKTDAVFHNFNDTEAFRRVYKEADSLISKILNSVDGNPNTILCSDHGIGPLTGYTVYLNQILHEERYLETAPNDNGPGDFKEMVLEEEGGVESNLDSTYVRTAIQIAKKCGIKPGEVYALFKRIGLGEKVKKRLHPAIQSSLLDGVDWKESIAYCRNGTELGIRLNLEGRDTKGVVPKSDYESVRSELIRVLRELQTPNGELVFEWVEPYEKISGEPVTGDACDILFLPTDMNHNISPKLLGQRFMKANAHDHKQTGIFIAQGKAFNELSTASLSLIDVAPIVMGSMNLQIPDSMEGSIPQRLFKKEPKKKEYRNVKFGIGVGGGEDDSVESRLQDLGYL